MKYLFVLAGYMVVPCFCFVALAMFIGATFLPIEGDPPMFLVILARTLFLMVAFCCVFTSVWFYRAAGKMFKSAEFATVCMISVILAVLAAYVVHANMLDSPIGAIDYAILVGPYALWMLINAARAEIRVGRRALGVKGRV